MFIIYALIYLLSALSIVTGGILAFGELKQVPKAYPDDRAMLIVGAAVDFGTGVFVGILFAGIVVMLQSW